MVLEKRVTSIGQRVSARQGLSLPCQLPVRFSEGPEDVQLSCLNSSGVLNNCTSQKEADHLPN